MARRDYEVVREGLALVGRGRANQRVPASTITTRVQETAASRANRGLPPVGVQRVTGGTLNLNNPPANLGGNQ